MPNEHETVCIGIDDLRYPPILRLIQGPPAMLRCRGDISVLSRPAVAVVGARKVTEYGKWAAFNLGKTLAEYGLTVVSGMAWGADSWAHRGALAAGGTTIAVLGCGVDICYPRNNAGLMREIMGRGLAVSEFEDGTEPKPYNFPVRNRVISGLSLATAVAEAGLNSGSLITAERAAEQGRLVYAVPGNINRASSIGCNRLIQDGAIALAVFDDIALDLGFKRLKAQERRENELGEDEKAVYEALRRCGEMSADELCADTGMPAWKMNGLITVLEMKGMVGTAMGRVFVSGV